MEVSNDGHVMRGQRCVDKEPEPFQIGQQYIYFNYCA